MTATELCNSINDNHSRRVAITGTGVGQFTVMLLSRWLSEEGRRQGSWIPFGSGPRMCVGYVFALQEMKVSASAQNWVQSLLSAV